MNLQVKILHYIRPDRPDRTKWVGVMKYMLNDPRVETFVDTSGTPYSGLHNAVASITTSRPTHILMLHHDVLPCFNFIPAVEQCVRLLPEEPITLYTNYVAARIVLEHGGHWLKLKIWYYTQAYVMPLNLLKDAIKWIDKNVITDDRNSDDERMAMYFYYHKRYVYATVPSLVEHLGWSSTTVDYDRPMINYLDNRDHRMARKFIGIDFNPLNIDWTKGLKKPLVSKEDWALEKSEDLFQKLLRPTSKFKLRQ